ncbi:hypothetical protein [Streptomyces noursei]|uniref:hypothetical protein n=1 Tax=Streptomyces noursei TaxID=1971 RepID=UPI00167B6654|nr:hypothetical protein [Streptomyces noursei]MCZ1017189.1 hypothetical protein [Streptomyces noursei]GGX11324.1 hypothetical protein GCM10010341_36120 [Streptomyces noursei]
MAVFGKFTGDIAPGTEFSAELHSDEDMLARDRFHQEMNKRGPLRDGTPNLVHTMNVSVLGLFVLDRFDPAGAELPSGRKADSSAHLVEQSFEPTTKPSGSAPRMASQEISAISADLLPSFRKRIHTHDLAKDGET